MSSAAGAVWLRQSDGGSLGLAGQQELDGIPQLRMPAARLQHARLLEKIVEGGIAKLVQPGARANGDGSVVNPTDYLLLVAPLRDDHELLGAIELFQHADKPTGVQPATSRCSIRSATLRAST